MAALSAVADCDADERESSAALPIESDLTAGEPSGRDESGGKNSIRMSARLSWREVLRREENDVDDTDEADAAAVMARESAEREADVSSTAFLVELQAQMSSAAAMMGARRIDVIFAREI